MTQCTGSGNRSIPLNVQWACWFVWFLQCSFDLPGSPSNFLSPPLSRLLVLGRPVPGAGKTLRGCYWQALREASRPCNHRRLQGTKARQPPSCLAHTVQWEGYSTTPHLQTACFQCLRLYGNCFLFSSDIKGYYPWNVSIFAWGWREICQEFLL